MEHHENNGHGESHDDHETEGNRQYYPKGWWVPLIGLLIVALGFTALGTFIFSHSGTERWGNTEQCDNNGKCCDDPNCKGDKCKDGDAKECKDDKGGCMKDKDGNMMMAPGKNDSMQKMMDEKKPESEHK